MKRFLAFALFIATSLAPLALPADQKNTNPDDRISDQVRMKLATDPDVKGGALDVTVKGGVVVIKGRVDTDRAKAKASRLAKRIKGVKEVDNEVVVGPPNT